MLLDRLDAPTIQRLLGQALVSVLRELDPELLTVEALRSIASRLIEPIAWVRDPARLAKILGLLPLDKARELASKLGLPVGADVYERLVAAAADKSQAAAFRSFFGVVDDPKSAGTRPALSEVVPARYGLFEHQRLAAKRCMEALTQGSRKVVLHMPTGAGKTRTAMHIVSQHLHSNENGLVVWLAQSAELLDQAAGEFEKAWSHIGNRDVELNRFWGPSEIDITGVHSGCLVAGLLSFPYCATIATDRRDA